MPEDFATRVRRAVDTALEPIGEPAKRSLYLYTRRKHKLARYEIPSRPSIFSTAIREVYGEMAQSVESRIISNIAKEFALEYISNSLTEAVDLA